MASLEDKFVGCIMGALVGDCCGAPFEFWDSAPTRVASFLQQKMAEVSQLQDLHYTDDTEMAKSVAESLVVCNGFDARDMVKRFVDEYFRSPALTDMRSYGSHVRSVFNKWKKMGETDDVFAPAAAQFGGAGSLGNGAAMRTHPVALFCHGKDQDFMLDMTRKIACLTHTNVDGYNGAILLTLAVRQALEADPNQKLDAEEFLRRLRTVMAQLESTRPVNTEFPSFCERIDLIKSSLEDQITNPIVLGIELGTDETANFSVPTSIFCFLRSLRPLDDFETDNPFLRALYLSASLGGDADTVGTMSCALSGAFHGKAAVPDALSTRCENWSQILDTAKKMAALVSPAP